jgi:prepilin-type N-terminal cleavage/methylation domain-containing protein
MGTRRERKKLQVQGVQVTRSVGVLNVRRSEAGRSTTQQMDFLRSRLGFTLLEVLVSLSIVAIAVTVVLQLFSADLRAIAASDDYASAVLKAEVKMREVLDNEDLTETSWSEATPDGYRMDVSVSEVLKEKTNNLQVRLLAVGLTTRWFKGTKEKTLALRTIKIVSKLAPVAGGTKAATSTAAPSAAAPAAAASGTAGSRMRSQ